MITTTLVVSVTVKIDVSGDTPDELINNAVMQGETVIEDALSSYYKQARPALARLARGYSYEYESPTAHHAGKAISVEGATALVNRQALEKMFA